MMSASIHLGPLMKKLRQVPREAARIMQHVVETDAKGFIKDIVAITPPSTGKANVESKRRGEMAIDSDLKSVYTGPEGMYPVIKAREGKKMAGAFWRLLQNDPKSVPEWLRRNAPSIRAGFDGGKEHQRRRNKRGRVTGKPTIVLFKKDMRAFTLYAKAQKARVGLLAAGFLPAARRLGVKLPAWVSRHTDAPGVVMVSSAMGKFAIVITNRARHGRGNDLSRRMRFVLQSGKRKKRAQNALKFQVRAALKAAQLTTA